MSLPTPNTRKEQYLNAIATGNASGLPTPITREEEYLEAIAKSGGGSGEGDMKKSVYDSDLAVAGAGGIKAFVNEAVDNVKNNSWSLGSGISITNNTDLNDITTVGNYYATTQTAATLSHCPTTGAFKLKVLYDVRETAPTYIEQVFNPISSYDEYRRYKSGSAEWSDWHLTNCNLDEEKGKVADNTSAIEAIVNEYGAKNLFPPKDISGTQAGLTVTMNSDGSITFHVGTSTNTENAFIYLNTVRLIAGQYYYSGGLPTSFNDKIVLLDSIYGPVNESDKLFTADGSTNYGMVILVYPQITLSQDVTFYPMIRDARITDPTYVPYAMTNRELTDRTERSIEYSGALDNLVKPGFYITASGVTNTPNDSDIHFVNNGLFVSGNGTNYCCQMIIDTRTQLFIRICNNGTWSNWAAYTKA